MRLLTKRFENRADLVSAFWRTAQKSAVAHSFPPELG
jgi:hypothetical protein